ncbi:MAG: tRNA uridine-5-carboxymethylaminomethyl(34) synthesis enzyme MnmG [Halobacteriovoraceae bacterium]|nr:tRNA uridine-5-carboxymethylaminomethyl(34) synthesis enzyme MnmG [Halobacteriovoraceae bacterium]
MFHVEQFNKDKNSFDLLVLGGGHAGVEAAWIANQFGIRVGLISIPGVGLASAPCNPAVGGVGKGQVVREIDALGGLMPRLADLSGIQYRTLNESKGYAVQSTRVQIDKESYSEFAEELIGSSSIIVIRDRIDSVKLSETGHFVLSSFDSIYTSKKLVVTTGTFLNGKLHTGSEMKDGGRFETDKSVGLDELFSGIKTLKKRFKTGTPPRINRKSINFEAMEPQPSDPETDNFHFASDENKRNLKQVDCYLTRTNELTLDLIRENKEKSPIFNGQIQGIGPRYCPSIEDKAFRYPDRHVHHVFVEPEGLKIDTFYPNGISTSLPKEIQEEFLRTIPGLEKAEIAIHGYAVEYDVVDTLYLNQTLEHQEFPGLFFAGQVCGTSGYEEAAGQGLIAGSNAALAFLGKKPLILPRNKSYIGVMVEDLCTNERDEPYRLFTARSENRLYIREDNSVVRLYEYRRAFNLNEKVDLYNDSFIKNYTLLESVCDSTQYLPNDKNKNFFSRLGIGGLSEKTSLTEVLQRSQVDPVVGLSKILQESGIRYPMAVVKAVAISIKYRGYIERENFENQAMVKLEQKTIEIDTILNNKNLSYECKMRIERIRPQTFGQLKRIEGIRPATLAYVAASL